MGNPTDVDSAATPLLGDDFVPAAVNYQGRPAPRSNSGGWRSASFIIGVEIAERFAYYGINSNLINFLTGPLGQSTATAAVSVNTWSGAASLLPLLGAFVADSYLGACSSHLQVVVFFFALYLVAAAQGGHKPCVQAFGADQFDVHDPKEQNERSTFFNWWYFGMCGGNLATVALLHYIQDNLGWVLGFAVPCIVMSLSLIIFFIGTMTYRFTSIDKEESPFVRIVFGIVFAQAFTFFTKQGVTMDRWLSSGIEVPAAALQSFINLSVVILIPMYLTPIARSLSGNPAGITMLQRIGVGIVSSTVCMAVAGTVERKRLERGQEYGLVDMPKETVPMSVCWLIPQYLLFGVAEVFTMVGLQEFFYDQVPSDLKSIGLALYLSIFGVGSFLSSFVIIIIERATAGENQDSWFSDNLNRTHLDYYYWLLAGLSVVAFMAYLYFAKSYFYDRSNFR